MTRDEFWKLIEDAGSGVEPEEQAEAIEAKLAERSPDDIVQFEHHLGELLAATYTWNLWGAAYLINGGCSDDGYEDFRGWLILQGRSVFEKSLADPDSLADLPDLEEDAAQCEDILSVAPRVYEAVVGGKIPESPIDRPELGERWDFEDDDEMEQRYPKLFAKLGV